MVDKINVSIEKIKKIIYRLRGKMITIFLKSRPQISIRSTDLYENLDNSTVCYNFFRKK